MSLKLAALTNIADGVAVELFQHEIAKVAKNIADQNTSATSKRSITLTFEFTPDDNREEVKVLVSSKSKTAPVKGYSKTVFCGKHDGVPTIFGQDTRQLDMLSEDVPQIGKAKANG